MRESRTSGSVEGVASDGHPYSDFPPSPKEGSWLAVCVGVLGSDQHLWGRKHATTEGVQMRHRVFMSVSVVAVLVVLVSSGAPTAFAQTTVPRTAWGQPDLQGVWDFRTITPLQRPEELGEQEFLTEEEAANLEQETIDRNTRLLNRAAERTTAGGNVDRREDGSPGFYNNFWLDQGTSTVGTRRTSLVIDPPNGRIPPITPEAQARLDAMREARQRPAHGPEDRSVAERCILGFNAGPPLHPSAYNNNIQLFQTPDHVVILTEMVHDVRIIPLDGRPHLSPDIRQWMGNSRGHWEGDTLVVDTTDFYYQTSFSQRQGSTRDMHLVERFRWVDADTLLYEFTVDDPATWTRSWTAAIPMTRSEEPIYEYACHEGNYGMLNILTGARAEDEAAAQAATQGAR